MLFFLVPTTATMPLRIIHTDPVIRESGIIKQKAAKPSA